jgi:hypothetical protein
VKRYLVLALCILSAAAAFASGAREDESFSYTGIDRVEIKSDFLDVEVRAEEWFSASMRSDLPQDSFFEQRRYTVKHMVDGGSLRVWVEKDFGLLGPRGRGTLFFRMPRGASLFVETSSGEVRITGSSARDVRVKTISGPIILRDVEASVQAETVSGSLEARRLRGEAALSTVSGEIVMSELRGRCDARTVSGKIDGRAILLEQEALFKSVSGEIEVNLRNPLEDVRFELSTVSGDLTIGTVRSSRGLRLGSGPILLRGETISGSQSYR